MHYMGLVLPNSIRNNRVESLILNYKQTNKQNYAYFHIVLSKPFLEIYCLTIFPEERHSTEVNDK